MAEHSIDWTTPLRNLMTQAEISSFRQLSAISGVPRSQILKMRRGQVERIPLGSFAALAQALNLSTTEVLEVFGAIENRPSSFPLDVEVSRRQWQQEGLNCLESLILQLPTAAAAAQNNPHAPAVRLLPLLKPLDQLLESWEVQRIEQVGTEVDFDPQWHQWMGGSAVPEKGERVKVSHVGYRHGDRLLHRAKVKPL